MAESTPQATAPPGAAEIVATPPQVAVPEYAIVNPDLDEDELADEMPEPDSRMAPDAPVES